MGQGESKQSEQGAEGTSRPESDVPNCDKEIFLIGRTGHGKSSTGNTILGRIKFKTNDSAESVTLETDVGWAFRFEKTIKVVDGPGLGDTRWSERIDLQRMEENLSKGFLHSPHGFHAMVLVLRYGDRFTKEQHATLKLLTKMLGENFLKEHCILAFTHGENFLTHHGDKKFKDWCKDQKGEFQELLKQCKNRVVLFYNMTDDRKDKSTEELISLTNEITKRYTAKLFDEIKQKRSEFIQKYGAIQLRPFIEPGIDLIIGYLKKQEVGHRLQKQVEILEEEIDRESSNLNIVKTLKQGIEHIRKGRYGRALDIFEEVQAGGRNFLFQFYTTVMIAVRSFIRSLFE